MPSMLSRLSSVKKMGGAERTTNGARLSASPFHNNDDPTPRHAPSSEEEERRLRAEAAAGAGTPGYLTKQQQHVPSSPTTSDDRPGSPLTPAATEGGAGRPSKKTSPHSDGRPISPDPTRLAATGDADSADAGECSTEGASSSSIPSPSADGPGGMPKPSDHQDGIWKGFLSIFSFEKKRASMGHLADGTYADYDEDDEDGGSSLALPPLGPGHDLPRPAALHLDIPSDQHSLLKKSVLEQGRRDSRSVSVLSPRGTAPVAGGTETAEEQRMRAFVQLEHGAEGDFVDGARKGAALSDPDAGGTSDRPGGGSRRRSDADADGSFGAGSAGKSRRSVGGVAPPAGSIKAAAVTIEGEAAPQIQKQDLPRAPAQERVFGAVKPEKTRMQQEAEKYDAEVRRSSVTEMPSSSPAGYARPPSPDSARVAAQVASEAAQKLYESLIVEFESANESWIRQQKECVAPPKSYTGPRLSSPPTAKDLADLTAFYTKAEPGVLHQRYLMDLLLAIKRQWECPPPNHPGQTSKTVIDLADPPEGSRIFIVGDTHGQLADVLWIFAEYGPPSRTNVYLFNGDVADRGSHAVEIFSLIFAYMLHEPGSVYLSRGNHENMEINERAQHYGGGFAEEVRSKFDPEVFMLFTSLFELLPLAFVVAQKALVIHGGLWRHRGVTLQQLRKLDNRRQCPEAPQTYDDYIFFDLLWSDPHPEDGDGVHESSRGDGCILFGRDMTVEFLRRNSLQLIVRSHQLPSDGHGYEVLHDGRCITVFSASNYGGSCYNAGAILVWENGEIDAHEFIAPNLEAQQNAASTPDGYAALLRRFSSRGSEWEEEVGCAAEPPHVARLDSEIVRMIKERICRYRHLLAAEFKKLDKGGSGKVTADQWMTAMSSCLQLPDIPWMRYQPWLVEIEGSDVEYGSFLGRFEVRLKELYSGWQRTVLQMFYNSLLAADLQISELLGFFDQDGDGQVSLHECTKALSSLELGLSRQQIQQLVLILGFSTQNNTEDIDLEAFLKRLALVADHTVIARSEQELLDLQQIARWIEGVASKNSQSLSALFKTWDDNSDGYIDYEEFVTCCFTCQEQLYQADPSSLEYIYTREEFDELARTIDQAKTGRINYLSFLGLFSAAEASSGTGPSPLLARQTAASVFIEQICATLWANDVVLTKAFRSHDPKGSGSVTPAHFRDALSAMNEAIAGPYTPITATQIAQLVEALPLDSDGRINYKEFMAAFEVRDKQHDA